MEDGKKKVLMVVVIVVCLAAAGVIMIKGGGSKGGRDEIPNSTMVWVTCRNQDCESSYQMGLQVYFTDIAKYHEAHPGTMAVPPLVCDKCGEESLYRAEKCPKCELVFELRSSGAGFLDRCPNPDCGFSQMEETRSERDK